MLAHEAEPKAVWARDTVNDSERGMTYISQGVRTSAEGTFKISGFAKLARELQHFQVRFIGGSARDVTRAELVGKARRKRPAQKERLGAYCPLAVRRSVGQSHCVEP